MVVLLNITRVQQVIRQRVKKIDTLTEIILATLGVQTNLHEHLGEYLKFGGVLHRARIIEDARTIDNTRKAIDGLSANRS